MTPAERAMLSDHETHGATYLRMADFVESEGMVAFLLVAVDAKGEVYWGGRFGKHPKTVLRYLEQMRKDVRSYIAFRAALDAMKGEGDE